MEIFKRVIIYLLMVVMVAACGFTQNNDADAPWFFIQITDPQFGMFERNEGFEKETILYEKAVAEVNRLRPDFVVITGDFVHNQHSQEQIEEFMRITAKIHPDIPVYYSPGNHDIGKNPDKQSLQRYVERYGEDRFAFEHKGSTFIGFNTGLIKAPFNNTEQEQYTWLTSKLNDAQGSDHIILFCHYPFFNKTIDEPEAYSNLSPDARQKYLPLFDSLGVAAVFSGHYHDNALATFGNIQLVTTSAAGRPLGDAPSGMRVVKVYQDRIEHAYYGMYELPDAITFGP